MKSTATLASTLVISGSALHELFLTELADILDAERQLAKALPKLAQSAQSRELVEIFRSHLGQAERQIFRLVSIFGEFNELPRSKACKAMKGLIEEGQDLIRAERDSPGLDAALIAATQKIKHYQIATYGTLRAWADQMGHIDTAVLLNESLHDEKGTDAMLTDIAQSFANREAMVV